MDSPVKSRSRRAEIRKNRPDALRLDWEKLNARGIPASLAIAVSFFLLATAILFLRQDVVPYRPDQPINHDIVSRITFTYSDKNQLEERHRTAQEREPRVYQPNPDDAWSALEKSLLALPEQASAGSGNLPADLKDIFDPGSLTIFLNFATEGGGKNFADAASAYVKSLREYRNPTSRAPIILLDAADRTEDLKARREIRIGQEVIDPARTYSLKDRETLRPIIATQAGQSGFRSDLQPKFTEFTLARLHPTHTLDDSATAQRRSEAVAAVSPRAGDRLFRENEMLVRKTANLSEPDWQILKAENQHYVSSLKGSGWKPKLGVTCLTFMLTLVLATYIAHFQPRIIKNHARAIAIAALLLSMLLLSALVGIGNGPMYLFGTAPTILTAMILSIAYDRRFAIGVASMHGLLVTVALNQSAPYFVILWVGVLTAGFLMGDLRARSKLIEVGGAAALAMIAATAAAGLLELDSPHFILRNCLYAGAAGLSVGFIVLGILPFIERMFRITTSMTLLELADVSHPLLRRLAQEAPGTYSHSLQVATLAEAAAEAIGAQSLLCRVGAYYHDVGKINKADYFIENQAGCENRHLNLTPNVSFMIIRGHVKDGIELAHEYHLPSSLIHFIQQHHGTTLVEHFYLEACARQNELDADGKPVEDHEFRYEGPTPRTREIAIVMVADAVESATRAMAEPTVNRVTDLVRDLALKRLLDRQFDDCELTMRDLDRIQESMVKTLMSIHHGRISYPSTSGLTDAEPPAPAVKLA